jgi:hypothetical protein
MFTVGNASSYRLPSLYDTASKPRVNLNLYRLARFCEQVGSVVIETPLKLKLAWDRTATLRQVQSVWGTCGKKGYWRRSLCCQHRSANVAYLLSTGQMVKSWGTHNKISALSKIGVIQERNWLSVLYMSSKVQIIFIIKIINCCLQPQCLSVSLFNDAFSISDNAVSRSRIIN